MARSIFRKAIQSSKNGSKWRSSTHQRDRCLNLDVYGKPISLTFHGSDSFKTRVGAIITIMAAVFLIGFGAFRLIAYNNSKKIVYIALHEADLEKYGDRESQRSPLELIAFGLGTNLVPEKVGEFTISYLDGEQQWQQVGILKCSEDVACKEQFKQFYPESLYVFDRSYSIKESAQVRMALEKCTGKSSCLADEEIEEYLLGKSFRIPVIEHLLNSDSDNKYASLIPEVYQSYVYPYLPGYSVQFDQKLDRGLVLKDVGEIGIFSPFSDQYQERFAIFSEVQRNYFQQGQRHNVLEFNMSWSKRAHLYTISSYSLADWLIDMGGISRAIYFAGLVAAHFIALRLYKAALIQDIFMFQQKPDYKPSYADKRKRQLSSENGHTEPFADLLEIPQYYQDIQGPLRMNTAPLQTQETLCSDLKTFKSKSTKIRRQDEMRDLFIKAVGTGGCLKKDHILDLVNTILQRKRASFTLKQIIADLFYSIIPCKERFLSAKIVKRRRMYDKARYMLGRSLDVKNLIRNSILSKLMLGTMFTREESLLLLFQRKQVIESDTDISSSASDISFKENFHAKMCSKNPWDQIFSLSRIFTILKEYQEKDLNEVDKKLIKGLYLRSNANYKHLLPRKPEDESLNWTVDAEEYRSSRRWHSDGDESGQQGFMHRSIPSIKILKSPEDTHRSGSLDLDLTEMDTERYVLGIRPKLIRNSPQDLETSLQRRSVKGNGRVRAGYYLNRYASSGNQIITKRPTVRFN